SFSDRWLQLIPSAARSFPESYEVVRVAFVRCTLRARAQRGSAPTCLSFPRGRYPVLPGDGSVLRVRAFVFQSPPAGALAEAVAPALFAFASRDARQRAPLLRSIPAFVRSVESFLP